MNDEQKALEIISQLNSYATDTDPYEFGLPNYGTDLDNMVDIVLNILKQ